MSSTKRPEMGLKYDPRAEDWVPSSDGRLKPMTWEQLTVVEHDGDPWASLHCKHNGAHLLITCGCWLRTYEGMRWQLQQEWVAFKDALRDAWDTLLYECFGRWLP